MFRHTGLGFKVDAALLGVMFPKPYTLAIIGGGSSERDSLPRPIHLLQTLNPKLGGSWVFFRRVTSAPVGLLKSLPYLYPYL